MSSVETGQMFAIETGQMSAAETGLMSSQTEICLPETGIYLPQTEIGLPQAQMCLVSTCQGSQLWQGHNVQVADRRSGLKSMKMAPNGSRMVARS